MRKRILAAVLLIGSIATGASAGQVERDVQYASTVRLAAALLLPDAPGPFPAIVIIQGSGSSDRSNQWARAIADQFVARGCAVLLTDKRGSGRSEGNWQTAGFEELADDARAGVKFLQTLKGDIDPARIGVAGLSQGGWIAPLVAAGNPDISFVIDISGATVSFAEQSFVEMRNTAASAGLSPAGVQSIMELNAAAGRFVTSGQWDRYEQLRERLLKGEAARIVKGFPGERNATIWTFLRKVFSFDPMPYWMVVDQPVLIAFGARDEVDNVPVKESVRRLEWMAGTAGRSNFTIVVAPDAGHALLSSRDSFSATFLAALDTFLAPHVGASGEKSRD